MVTPEDVLKAVEVAVCLMERMWMSLPPSPDSARHPAIRGVLQGCRDLRAGRRGTPEAQAILTFAALGTRLNRMSCGCMECDSCGLVVNGNPHCERGHTFGICRCLPIADVDAGR